MMNMGYSLFSYKFSPKALCQVGLRHSRPGGQKTG